MMTCRKNKKNEFSKIGKLKGFQGGKFFLFKDTYAVPLENVFQKNGLAFNN